MRAAEGAAAIGRIERGGPWVGFVRGADGGYRLAFGDGADAPPTIAPDGQGRRADLMALAIAYFAEVFADAPVELEATQRDIGDLVRWLTESASDPAERHQLREALDGIDDGLAADAVIGRLRAALVAADPDDSADAVSRLRVALRSIRT